MVVTFRLLRYNEAAMQSGKKRAVAYGIMYGAGFVVFVGNIIVAFAYVENTPTRWFLAVVGTLFAVISLLALIDVIRHGV